MTNECHAYAQGFLQTKNVAGIGTKPDQNNIDGWEVVILFNFINGTVVL